MLSTNPSQPFLKTLPSHVMNWPSGLRNAIAMATTAATARTVQPTGPEKNASSAGSKVPVKKVSRPVKAAEITAIAGPAAAAQLAIVAASFRPLITLTMPIKLLSVDTSVGSTRSRPATPAMVPCNQPGIAAKPSAMPTSTSVNRISTGISAVPSLTLSSTSLVCKLTILSLTSSAPLANLPVMVTLKLSTALRPPLSNGIMSAPDLPNS